ncbi:MAG TPA: hypothetical protein VM865_02595 [Acidobacteriaceae bacterium]|nr:hypothetical protein [Acidobacteriaceae bacterium]
MKATNKIGQEPVGDAPSAQNDLHFGRRPLSPEDRATAISLSGLLLTIFTIAVGLDQTRAGRSIPFQTSLYETRVSAMQGYARAHYRYDNALRAIMSDMPYDVYSPEGLASIGDEGMQQSAMMARRLADLHADYTAEVNGMMGLWPEKIQRQVGLAGEAANSPSLCFFKLGEHTLANGTYSDAQRKEHWTKVRLQAAPLCNSINDHRLTKIFREEGRSALSMMQEQLTQTHDDLVPGAGT